jgi:AAA ATPase domain
MPSYGPFVGRAVEVEVFDRAVDRARGGVPSVVVVAGDAGAGKTTLVGEAAARPGARLLVGHCVRVGAHGLALAAIADLPCHGGVRRPRYDCAPRCAHHGRDRTRVSQSGQMWPGSSAIRPTDEPADSPVIDGIA